MSIEFKGFPKDTLIFLTGLSKNNSKKWFDSHRSDYDVQLIEPAKAFTEALGKDLRKLARDVRVEPRVNGSIKRMNRDVRFSKDKSPYKEHLDFAFKCGEDSHPRPSFFMRLSPVTVCVGLGFYQFEKNQLAAYREAVADGRRGAALQKSVDALVKKGYRIAEPAYKRVPKGYDPDHKRSALLRCDTFYILTEVKTPRVLHSPKFVDWCADRYTAMAPVFKWLDQLR